MFKNFHNSLNSLN